MVRCCPASGALFFDVRRVTVTLPAFFLSSSENITNHLGHKRLSWTVAHWYLLMGVDTLVGKHKLPLNVYGLACVVVQTSSILLSFQSLSFFRVPKSQPITEDRHDCPPADNGGHASGQQQSTMFVAGLACILGLSSSNGQDSLTSSSK